METDVVLVGAGPIGLEIAVALKKAGIDYLHIDKGQIAATIAWFPQETNVPRLYVAGTATAGTQASYRVFIENCHVHAERIVAALMGQPPPPRPEPIGRPES